ncbi:MAG: sodium:proton exchanger [Candidatus Dormibacteraeota bacterium]|jgi:Ca2+:H+ antiporter|nr:sodium:proton exchanger [Candidatus Dormibacteraeota bacterium]
MDALRRLRPRTLAIMGTAGAATAVAGVLNYAYGPSIVSFAVSTVALAALAVLVGEGTENLGSRLGPAATGVLQSALGNLPELLIGYFALRAGLVAVVQAALIGSILGNSLLVLGIAFVVGGIRHGTQRFASAPPRLIALMTMLSASAVALPTLAVGLHTPAAGHRAALSVAVAVVLLVVFVGTVVSSLRDRSLVPEEDTGETWPLPLAAVVLAASSVAAAFVADWFVAALRPAIQVLGITEGFTGLVIVALAGNAVENAVGVRMAALNRSDLAISVILNSSLQIALALIPALVLLSLVVGGAQLTLVLPPLLVAALGLTAILTTVIVYDGESTWVEGLALVGLYAIIAATFWWG